MISSIALAQDNQGNNDESDQMEQLEALDIEVAKRERPSTKTAPAPIIEKKITADDLVLPRGLEKDLVNLSKDESLEGKEFIQQEIRNNLFKENFRALSLSDVIEEGLRQNHQQIIRGLENEENKLVWENNFEKFWVPKLQISLQTNPQSIGKLHTGTLHDTQIDRSPQGALSFGFADYTVFNWGKDYLKYLNDKNDFQRTKKRLEEERRNLRLKLIDQYFKMQTAKESERIQKDELRHAAFIYRLNREKVSVQKVTREEYYQARDLFLKAQQNYFSAKVKSEQIDEELSNMLDDAPHTRYLPNDEIDFKKIRITAIEAQELAKNHSSIVLDAKADFENAQRNYEVAVRENLPLPKVNLNLGAYQHRFSGEGSRTRYETSPGNSDIELVASINATWALTGEGGLLNGRRTGIENLKKEIALRRVRLGQTQSIGDMANILRDVVTYETQLEITQAKWQNLQKSFDTTLENYMNKRTRFQDLKDVLQELTQTENYFYGLKYEHLSAKLALAKIIGVEDLPGENFEKTAKRSKGK